MIENISHITFVVKNLEKTSTLFKKIFDAKEVYNSGEKIYSLSKERFFIIGNHWIAVMESEEIINRTYHHVAFKINLKDYDTYLEKIRMMNLEIRPARPRVEGEGASIYFYDYDNNLFELHTGTLEERLLTYTDR